jgi:hypothetical protein
MTDIEEMIYDEGYYEGLRFAWHLMFSGVLADRREFVEVLKELANARDNARLDFEQHTEGDE